MGGFVALTPVTLEALKLELGEFVEHSKFFSHFETHNMQDDVM